jgi:hypothetical protein
VIHALITVYSNYSYRKRGFEYLIRLTDSFTWEDLPIRDPDTGYLTKAGLIPINQSVAKYVTILAFSFHITQSTARIVMSRDMIFTSWYPFDATKSPSYEFTNLIQVLYFDHVV